MRRHLAVALLAALRKLLPEQLTPADFRLVMSGNAERLFRVPAAGGP